MKQLLNSLKQTQKRLKKYARSLPNQDAYSEAYSLLADMIDCLGDGMKELKPALNRAKVDVKANPDQIANRAKKWCKF